MSHVVVYAEKPDIGTRIAATLGGCMIGGTELKPDMVNDKKYEALIKRERSSNGFLKCNHKGQEYIVTWGYGHLVTLKQAQDYDEKYARWDLNLFPFVPGNYELMLIKQNGVSKQFNLVKRLFTDPNTKSIINATDADREGELIFDYVYRLSGCRKPFQRLWLKSTTEEAILSSFYELKPSSEVLPLAYAGRCRAISDWLIGSNFTAVATLKYGGFKNMISIGRVQTPTLAILVNRELEIRDFKPETYFDLIGTFATDQGATYKGKWKKEDRDRFSSKQDAELILNKLRGKPGLIIKHEESTSEEKPPLLYDLTSLQMDANAKFGFSAQKTLDTAQKLYESQYITYPRTTSRYLPEDMKGDMQRIIRSLPNAFNPFRDTLASSSLHFSNRYFNNAKVESHHAIIPTYKLPSDLSPDEVKLYFLIAASLIKAFLPSAVRAHSKIETKVSDEFFYSSGRTLIEPGWRTLDIALDPDAEDQDDQEEQTLPPVQVGQAVYAKEYVISEKKTKVPKRFTEKTLLAAMETAGKMVEDEELRDAMKDHGIGTPATRAPTIERLIKVSYVARKGKALIPTEKGIEVIKTFPIAEVKSPALTGDWEFKLNLIEKGQLKPDEFLKQITDYAVSNVNALKSSPAQAIQDDSHSFGVCPECGQPIIKSKIGWSCSGWKAGCKFVIWDNEYWGKKLTPSLVKQLLLLRKTDLVKGLKKKSGGTFNAALALVKDDTGKWKVTLDFK